MEAHYLDWLHLVIRWLHFTVGVAWIGASFYFNWLENNLERRGQRDDVAGSLWAVHGGGFYYIEKYKLEPPAIPAKLHWFKWEAYFTWMSGFALLAVVYYAHASLYLVGGASLTLTPEGAIALSVASLLCGWFCYDALCRSPLGTSNSRLALVGAVLVAAAAYGFQQVFSPRAAYLHVGALLGTCMAANVFRVIIPSQKALVAAATAGDAPDPRLGKKAQQRSLHNNYMTLPVLFIMISNHFPGTYGHAGNWLLLCAIALLGAVVRHWFNLKGRGQYNLWLLPAACLGMLALAFVTRPETPVQAQVQTGPVAFAEVHALIKQRCAVCHSAKPSDDTFQVAPTGVMFDTPAQIQSWAERIKLRAVTLETMPFANKTGMTKEERARLGAWIDQGAKLDP